MVGLGPLSASVQLAAVSQDMIWWRKFIEGKVSTKIAVIQQTYCASAPCMMNSDEWMRHFISHILHITHSQWIFRKVTLRDRIRDTLRLQKQKEVLREVKIMLETDRLEVPTESKFLLEFDFDSLYQSFFEQQTYCVQAIKAA
jgi:hypothetical protein